MLRFGILSLDMQQCKVEKNEMFYQALETAKSIYMSSV
jgi:hypothetical protein